MEGLAKFAGCTFNVLFQNENIIVENTAGEKKEILATVPDLISILDSETGEVIPTEEIRYGLRVSVIVLPCSPLLSTDKALQVVGPKAFGYKDCSYQACQGYNTTIPIPVKK